jgi:glutathione S-transferase
VTTLFQGPWRDVYLMRWGRRHPVGYVRRVDMAGISWWEAADRDRIVLKSSYGAVRRWMERGEAEEAVRLHTPRATDG